MSIHGSCLCQGVKYAIEAPLGQAINCHCSMCRKATGAALRSRASVPAAAFRWLCGEEMVSRYESSPGEARSFCRVCGATLPTFFRDHPEFIGLPLGTLDDDPGVRPSAHVFVASKAPWFEITDRLPQFPEGLMSAGSSEVSSPALQSADPSRLPRSPGQSPLNPRSSDRRADVISIVVKPLTSSGAGAQMQCDIRRGTFSGSVTVWYALEHALSAGRALLSFPRQVPDRYEYYFEGESEN